MHGCLLPVFPHSKIRGLLSKTMHRHQPDNPPRSHNPRFNRLSLVSIFVFSSSEARLKALTENEL